MDTMYAGRPGTPFIIKKAFKTVKEMQEEFKNGDSSDVWFGEYCIIDTVNKNDRTNGSIYQRGPNYAKNDGDARYIGRVVGPASGTPSFSLGTLEDVKAKVREEVSAQKKHVFPSTLDDAVNGLHFDDGDVVHKDGWDPKLDIKSLSVGNVGLVPGKTTDGTYNDDVKYTWCNIEYPQEENSPTITYVGFEVPYHVFEFTASMRSPYDKNGHRQDTLTFDETDESKNHPFYHSYKFEIPRGITGVCVKTVKICKVTEILDENNRDLYGVDDSGKMYRLSDLVVKSDGSISGTARTYVLPTPGGAGVCQDPQVILIELVGYANEEAGEAVWAYVSDYDVLDNISVANDGTLTKKYTYSADSSQNKLVKWIDDVQLSEDGTVTTIYNTGETNPLEQKLRWIKDFRLMDDGSIIVDYNNGNPSNFMKFLKWIDDVQLSEDGVLTIQYNTDHGQNVFKLNWIKDVALSPDSDILGDKRIQTTNARDEKKYIGSPINYLLDVYMRPSDYHLMLLYNDPKHRGKSGASGNVKIDNDSFKDSKGNTWVRKVHEIDGVLTAADTAKWDTVYWQDMGAIKDQSGLLVGHRITYKDAGTTSTASDRVAKVIDYLGKNADPSDGKMYMVGDDEDQTNPNELFAYDYDSHKWYYLGSVGGSTDKLDLAPDGTDASMMKSTGYYVVTGDAPAKKTLTKFWQGWV